jgi:putative ABC transport system permease protein
MVSFMSRNSANHLRVTLKVTFAHYCQAPLQAFAILIGIVLAVTLFVAVQAVNLNAKRSYAESTESLSIKSENLIIPLSGQRYLPESLYFKLRQSGLSRALPVIKGRVRESEGRRYSIEGIDIVAAITSRLGKQTQNDQEGADLFTPSLPLSDLLAGKAIVIVSESQHKVMGGKEQITLDDVVTSIVVVPDKWQLGSRLIMDIGFAQSLLNKVGLLSYIAVLESASANSLRWQSLIADDAQWIVNTKSTDLGSLTDSFHLNLTAMSLLAFLVGLFIAYNGVKYSLLKRNRLLVQLQQAGLTASTVFLSLIVELIVLVGFGTTLGFILGIQLSHWLHPTVALTLEQLYGATLFPGTWKWQWWGQALLLTLAAALLACWQHFKLRVNQPLSSHGGFYQTPEQTNENFLVKVGGLLIFTALLGLWLSSHFRLTMFWLGVLIVAIPMLLPKSLGLLARWAEQRANIGLGQYLFAELKELVAPLSLAMMALLLAITANIGMNTLVGSFETTLKHWLEQRLHADIYISPSQAEMVNVEKKLEQFEQIEEVYKQYYVQEKVGGLPTRLGTKDRATLEQTMVFHSNIADFWYRFYLGEVVAISEPMAVKLDLSVGSIMPNSLVSGVSLSVGAIFYDYGSPDGEVLISPQLWQSQGFSMVPSSLGIKVAGDKTIVLQTLKDELQLHSSQLFDQQEIKSIALDIFSRTFAITSILNWVTLLVAVVGLFTSCFMLLEARKAAIARLYALGVYRAQLFALVIGQMVALVLFTLVVSLPLGALVGYVLTDIVTLRAFGWSLNFVWNWMDVVSLAFITVIVAVIATIIPLWRLVTKPVVSSLQSEVM